MLIIEGSDLVGKTTLCEALVKHVQGCGWPAVYSHFTKLPETFHHVLGYLPHMQRMVIRDRFYVSRMAYSRACMNQRDLSARDWAYLDGRAAAYGALHVIFTADDEDLRQRFKAEREMYDIERILAANREFKGVAEDAEGRPGYLHFHLAPGEFASKHVAKIADEWMAGQSYLNFLIENQCKDYTKNLL